MGEKNMMKVMRKGDRTVQLLCCGTCGQWIDDFRYAGVGFPIPDGEGDVQPAEVAHKGACLDALEAKIRSTGKSFGWHELRSFMLNMCENSSLTTDAFQQLKDDQDRYGSV